MTVKKDIVVYVLLISLVPLIPVVLLFSSFVSEAAVQGVLGSLKIQLVGAIGAYFALVLLMYRVVHGLDKLRRPSIPTPMDRRLSRIFRPPLADPGFDVAGMWLATYEEYRAGDSRTEQVHVVQERSEVWGEIESTDRGEPPWQFRGTMRDGVLVAYYWAERAYGHYHGTFTLVVTESDAVRTEMDDHAQRPRATKLAGQYVGFESAKKGTVGSEYTWVRMSPDPGD